MRHEQDRRSQRPPNLLQFPLQVRAHNRVQRPERLIHQQDIRAVRQRPGHAHALALPARQLGWVAISHFALQTHQRQELECALAGFCLVDALQTWNGRDIVCDASMRKQATLLQDVTDRAAQAYRVRARHVRPAYEHRARGRGNHRVHHPHERRFAAARCAQEHGRRALLDGERKIVDGSRAARVGLGDVIEANHARPLRAVALRREGAEASAMRVRARARLSR